MDSLSSQGLMITSRNQGYLEDIMDPDGNGIYDLKDVLTPSSEESHREGLFKEYHEIQKLLKEINKFVTDSKKFWEGSGTHFVCSRGQKLVGFSRKGRSRQNWFTSNRAIQRRDEERRDFIDGQGV